MHGVHYIDAGHLYMYMPPTPRLSKALGSLHNGARCLDECTTLGLCMDEEVVRIAVGLCLGVPLCHPHTCSHCGIIPWLTNGLPTDSAATKARIPFPVMQHLTTSLTTQVLAPWWEYRSPQCFSLCRVWPLRRQ